MLTVEMYRGYHGIFAAHTPLQRQGSTCGRVLALGPTPSAPNLGVKNSGSRILVF